MAVGPIMIEIIEKRFVENGKIVGRDAENSP
jgi:hypothetical protein